MKILEAQSAVLSNAEVLTHLDGLKSCRQSTKPPTSSAPPLKSPNYETIIKELIEYLAPSLNQRSPLPPYASQTHNRSSAIKTLVQRLKQYYLAKGELLMILNLRPQDLGFLDCVIEECDLRFSQEDQVEILRIIGECLGTGEVEYGLATKVGENHEAAKSVDGDMERGQTPGGQGEGPEPVEIVDEAESGRE